MLAVLNVSLDEKVHANPDSRWPIAIHAARNLLAYVAGERQQVSYAGPDGQVTEACAVIVFEVFTGQDVLRDAIYMMSHQLGQDCIAVVWPDGCGETVGPNADRWPFDRQYFNMPGIFKAHQNAGSI